MASAYLSRSITSSTNNTKFTISVWVKKLKQVSSSYQNIINSRQSGTTSGLGLWFGDNDEIFYNFGTSSSASSACQTNAKYRDNSAWYHIVLAGDASQSGTDKLKFYVNGEQITSFQTDNRSSFTTIAYDIGDTTYPTIIGRKHDGTYQFDGSMAHFHFVDGTAYQASTFGETDTTTGIWKPKTAPSVTYGNNGFFLRFDNSGNMGLDSSGQSNNFTTNGTIIQNKDTPSNVFATINPLDYSPNPATLENTNTTYNKSSTGSGHNATMTGTLGVTKGKYYFEFKPTNTSAFVAGIVRTNHGLPNSEGYYATDAGSYGITNGSKIVGGSEQSQTVSYSANDIFGMAYDLDNGKFYVHINGTYLNSGDPTSGSTGTGSLGDISLGSNIYVPVVSNANYDQTNVMHFNFGNGYFGTTAVTSAQNPDDGIGIFEYDVPAGYRALCTKSINAQEYS